MGAQADGTLDAITHDAVTLTSQYEDYFRQETGWSGLLYTAANAQYAHRLAKLDLPTSCDMRCPSAAPAVYALECAMDELAVALKIDPLELRLRCYSERDQHNGRPYSSKALRECYRQGAEAFGWQKRNPAPARDARRRRSGRLGDGERRLGRLPGADHRAHPAHRQRPCRGRLRRPPTSAPAPTRSWPRSRPTCWACRSTAVSVKLGNSTLPQSPVEGGSWLAASVSNGIAGTADAIRQELLRLAKQIPSSPLAGADPADVALADGRLVSRRDGARAVSIADAMRHGWRGRDRAGGHHQPRRRRRPRPQHPFRRLRRGQGGRADRRDPRHPHRQRGRGRAHPEHQDGGQPDPRRRRLGHRHGAARGNRDRPPASAAS